MRLTHCFPGGLSGAFDSGPLQEPPQGIQSPSGAHSRLPKGCDTMSAEAESVRIRGRGGRKRRPTFFFGLMALASLPVEFVEAIGETVRDVIRTRVDPEKVSSGPTARYFFVRALARDAELRTTSRGSPSTPIRCRSGSATMFTPKVSPFQTSSKDAHSRAT